MQEIKTDVVVAKRTEQVQFPLFLARYILFALLALFVVWLLIKAYVIGSALFSLRQSQIQLQTMLTGGITQLDGDEVEALILDVRQDILSIESETAVFYPLLIRLNWVPTVGPTLAVTPQLLDMATGGMETAAYAIRGLKPAFAVIKDDSLSSDAQITALLQVIHQAQPDINQAHIAYQEVIQGHQAIANFDAQPEQIQRVLTLADDWLPIGNDGLKFLTVLPEIAGINGPKTYLVLAQNEDELRGSGGFISGSGIITVDKGQLSTFTYQDAYRVDNFTKPYGDPPPGLAEVMGFELFLFRDSNYWPDFPTSAEQSMALYSYGLGIPDLDGAVAFNQQFLSHILEITGPVPIPESNVTLTSGNVSQAIRNAWEEGSGEAWRGDRKDFLGTFATALQDSFFANPTELDPIALAQEMTTAIHNKDLMLYMTDPSIATVLNELNWDGRLENPRQSDYLMVADTNVGFNKTNLFLERQLNYNVTISANLLTNSTLQISYLHNAEADPNCIQDEFLGPIQPTYTAISNQCYFNYVRVYTPQNTALTESGTYPISQEFLIADTDWPGNFSSVQDLPNWSVFDNLLLIESGQSTPYQLSYQNSGLINEIESGLFQYALEIGTQSGLLNETRTISITLPEGREIVFISPQPTQQLGTQLLFENITETSIEVLFR
ncbi:MAG: DUF4012 domain-containing protein [Chloroflexota bacterium]